MQVDTNPRDVVSHFIARASTYDASSRWCTDPGLMAIIIEAAAPKDTDTVLDVACGTGLVSAGFKPYVARTVGVDVTPAMATQAAPWLDDFHLAPAEQLPFEPNQFDLVVCRQGIQFMDATKAVSEMVRVTSLGGRVVLINLCGYDQADLDEYREILQLRNPARRNFFVPDDLSSLLAEAGCVHVQTQHWTSEEDADAWSDNGAIDLASRSRIRHLYETASPRFHELHGVHKSEDGHIVDRMLFTIAVGHKY